MDPEQPEIVITNGHTNGVDHYAEETAVDQQTTDPVNI
jgi:hypothetical protein